MLSMEDLELLQRINVQFPQFIKLLERRLNNDLSDLPSRGLDKVQVSQGRCLMLQELLADFKAASGISANRTAKPQL